MAGDYSRIRFDPKDNHAQLLLEQGRPVTDSDFNEHGDILRRRIQAQTVDTFGRCVVPSETPDGFHIDIAGSGVEKSLTIGLGRMYVDGFLAENHGEEPLTLDLSALRPDGNLIGVLAEQIGLEPKSYFNQPYWPSPDPLPDDGTLALVYLKVWHREITALLDDSLLEPALGGVDTTTRRQTVWQVRLLEVADDVLCSSPDAEIDPWQQLLQPSAALLSTRTVEQESGANPCLIPQTSGYKGAENQLYRIEIHDGGPAGEATFKWSRDNASVAASILSIDGRNITVDSTGRDSVLSIQNNGWVEITDDARELNGEPGFMVQVINIKDRVITLGADLPEDLFPDGLNAEHHPRVTKWDSEDAISVSVDTGISIGDGIEIEFSDLQPGGEFKTGDYWLFTARTATGDIERLNKAPPHGPYYHYCRLALVRWPVEDNELPRVDDCRILWPTLGRETCGCSVCVTAETHNSGALTIHQAVAQVEASGGTVCLASGEYVVEKSIQITERRSIHLIGQGMATTLSFMGTGPAVVVDESMDIVLERFSILVPGLPRDVESDPEDLGGGPGFLIRNSHRVTVQGCTVNQVPTESLFATGIVLAGVVLESVFRENVFFTTSGVIAAPTTGNTEPSYLLSADLDISDNLFLNREQGVGLDRLSFFLAGSTHIRGNSFVQCERGAVSTTGVVFESQLDICNNKIRAAGPGIIAGTDNTRICDNLVSSLPEQGSTNGIVITAGLDDTGIDALYITGNRLAGLSLSAILLGHVIHTAMIKQNVMALTEQGGILMASGATANALEIEDNQFVGIAQSANISSSIAAIRIYNTEHVKFANNLIKGVALNAVQPQIRAAIETIGCRQVFVTGNDIVDVGPMDHVGLTAGIQIRAPFVDLVIKDNVVRRNSDESAAAGAGDWCALCILGQSTATGVLGAGGLTAPVAPGVTAPVAPGLTAPVTSVGAPVVGSVVGSAIASTTVSSDLPLAVVTVGNRLFSVTTDFTIVEAGSVSETRLTVQGNQLTARGGAVSTLQIQAGDLCILTGNQISGEPLTQGIETARVKTLQAVVSSNIIRGPAGAQSLVLDVRDFTVLGNVTSGPIRAGDVLLENASSGAGLNIVRP